MMVLGHNHGSDRAYTCIRSHHHVHAIMVCLVFVCLLLMPLDFELWQKRGEELVISV